MMLNFIIYKNVSLYGCIYSKFFDFLYTYNVQRFNANGIESICILEKILAIFSQLVYVICGFVNLKRVNIKDITLFVSFYYV